MSCPDDCIGFPVAVAPLAVDHRGSVINAYAVGNLAAANISAVAFTLFFLAAQMAIRRPTAALATIKVEIYTFRADALLSLELQAATDLFGTPLPAQK